MKSKMKPGEGGRKGDLQLSWLPVELGVQWEEWRSLAAGWIAIQERGLNHRLYSLRALFGRYLCMTDIGASPSAVLDRRTSFPDFYEAACPRSAQGVIYNNHARAFLQWVLESRFSEPDDYGRPVVLAHVVIHKVRHPRRSVTNAMFLQRYEPL